MNIAEKPIAMIQGRRISTGDGIHLIANEYPRGTRLDTHMHREAQLVYAARGTMQVTTPKGRWLVPPDRAVWVPARLAHSIDVLADIDMRTLYFDVAWLAREREGAELNEEFVVRVSCLLHETILALFDGRNERERTTLLIRLALLELHQAEDSMTFVPLPREPRCRRAASMVLDDPTAPHDIETLARQVGTSARTLSRLFASETKLSFKSWCQRARIAAAVERLSSDTNVSIKQVAGELGYTSLPAFSHAFRQVTGRTPTDFVQKA
jgi:AraC-like DNA-binding protein/quercetin dioxygenase-like cupin family protein